MSSTMIYFKNFCKCHNEPQHNSNNKNNNKLKMLFQLYTYKWNKNKIKWNRIIKQGTNITHK
jgi:hypothetical protein